MPTLTLNSKVDAYLEKTAAFAQPILAHLRELVHKGCPEVQEEVKWSRPFFVYKGTVLCNMAAFKGHCSFGFWVRRWVHYCARPMRCMRTGWVLSDRLRA